MVGYEYHALQQGLIISIQRWPELESEYDFFTLPVQFETCNCIVTEYATFTPFAGSLLSMSDDSEWVIQRMENGHIAELFPLSLFH